MKLMMPIDAAWFRPLWLGLLVAVTAVLTGVFTCITPFAAFAAVAATTLSRRDAVILAVIVWLTNQAVGFGVLSYPWTASTLAWGVAIGAAAVAGTLAAHGVVGRLGTLSPFARTVAAFGAAFGFYELTMYTLALSVLGGTRAFTPAIIGQVLLVNAVAVVGVAGLYQLIAAFAFLSRRRRAHVSPARFAS
jgi:hypothetical protein